MKYRIVEIGRGDAFYDKKDILIGGIGKLSGAGLYKDKIFVFDNLPDKLRKLHWSNYFIFSNAKFEKVAEPNDDKLDRGDENVDETLPDNIQLEFDMMHFDTIQQEM